MTDTTALAAAIGEHLAGNAEAAAQTYLRILEDDPIHPEALHYYGIYLYQAGRHAEAIESLELAAALDPGQGHWHNDRGNVLFAQGLWEAAAEAYQEAVSCLPEDAQCWTNLGSALRQMELAGQARSAFLHAVALQPDNLAALQQLGAIYEQEGDKMQASHYQCRAYVLPPWEGKSRELLGISFYFLNRLEDAAEVYRTWLSEEPDHPVAAHMLAACSQQEVPVRASDAYIERHFDRYAETFEQNLLHSLDYRGAQMIATGLAQIDPPVQPGRTVDLGCGTGLCAPVLARYSSHLVGVDLSGKMLAKAAAGGHYDLLVKSEIGRYLASVPASCELIAAADTLIYFGNLVPLLASMHAALKEGGYLVFTIEVLASDEAPGQDLLLHPSGRYRHRLDAVARLLAHTGLALRHHSLHVLRKEIGADVAGAVFVAQRTA